MVPTPPPPTQRKQATTFQLLSHKPNNTVPPPFDSPSSFSCVCLLFPLFIFPFVPLSNEQSVPTQRLTKAEKSQRAPTFRPKAHRWDSAMKALRQAFLSIHLHL